MTDRLLKFKHNLAFLKCNIAETNMSIISR